MNITLLIRVSETQFHAVSEFRGVHVPTGSDIDGHLVVVSCGSHNPESGRLPALIIGCASAKDARLAARVIADAVEGVACQSAAAQAPGHSPSVVVHVGLQGVSLAQDTP